MYEKRNHESNRGPIHMICLEDLVPKNHILRAINATIDFKFIYDEVEGMHSKAENGRTGIDPVSLFKIVMIKYIFGMRSMRQTIKEIESNYAYRWFIGYDIVEDIPHFSTFEKNYTRRFKDTDIFERIFTHILNEAVRHGLADENAVFIDGTHIKAIANKRKSAKRAISVQAKNTKSSLTKKLSRIGESMGRNR